MGQTQHKPHGLLYPNPWSAPQLTVAMCVLLRAEERKKSTDPFVKAAAYHNQASCCKGFKKTDLKSSHKSKCKQFIQGCGNRSMSVQPHLYNGSGGMSWEFMRTEYSEASGKQNYSYCAKNITIDPESAWEAVRGGATKKHGGCRRPYGSGPGFCNGKNQQSCVRSSACSCTFTQADAVDDDSGSSNAVKRAAAKTKIEQLILNPLTSQ